MGWHSARLPMSDYLHRTVHLVLRFQNPRQEPKAAAQSFAAQVHLV